MRWKIYILFICLQICISWIGVKISIDAIPFINFLISPIYLTILIIPGKIIKKILLGILSPILSFTCWSNTMYLLGVFNIGILFKSFEIAIYLWFIYNMIVVEIVYQIDRSKWFSK